MYGLPSVREVWLALQAPARQAATNASVRQRLDAVLAWVRLAHAGTRDGGISKGYDLLRRRWWPSYPETTGYTIPTLLRAAADLCRPDLRPLAVSLAEWLISVATSEGGIGHWGDPHTPVVFDTGQVILGWLSAYETSTDERYLEAAIRAGDWLSSVQDRTGMWKDHQHLGVAKVIDTRVAWALLELSRRTGSERYRQAAVRNLEWALLYQDPDGWFSRCAFVEGDDPFTHTIAYTAEGLLECGCLLEEVRYVEAARKNPILGYKDNLMVTLQNKNPLRREEE